MLVLAAMRLIELTRLLLKVAKMKRLGTGVVEADCAEVALSKSRGRSTVCLRAWG